MAITNQAAAVPRIKSERARIVQLVWYLTMALALIIFVAALPGYINVLPEGSHVGDLVATPSNLDIGLHLLTVLISISSVLFSLVLAWQLFRQKSSERMAAFVSLYLIIYAVGFSGPLEMAQNLWAPALFNFFDLITAIVFGPLSIALITLFPDGRFVPAWSKWLVYASLPLIPLSFFYEEILLQGDLDIRFWLAVIYSFGLFITGIASQVYRYRNVSRQIEKQQIKWVLYGISLWLLLIILTSIPFINLQLLPAGSPLPWWASISSLAWTIALSLLPISLSISVLRYRLYDIDIIINRTLVFTLLTALVIILYIGVVSALGALFQTTGNTITTLVSTAVIALLFNPLRARLQVGANRMMFGDRNEPFEVVRRLGRRLETNVDPATILPAIVETVTQTLKIPFAQITLLRGSESYSAASQGKAVGNNIRYPLAYQKETIGYLDVSPRTPGEDLSEADQSLLRQIARQAGPAVQAVRLTQDLQKSRINLVTAREEERRRLRRDLHDGLGPVLASQGLKMAAASQLLRSDPKQAQQLLDDLASQNESTVAEVRRLVNDLRPATLDSLGLLAAVSDYALEFGDLKIKVEAVNNSLPDLPAAIEVAAYRIATEAITNVSRHAKANFCKVKMYIENEKVAPYLCLVISDDGIGMPLERSPGLGLTSMRERAEEIGGTFATEALPKKGTKISARLPLQANSHD
jgi:signal transduction histidine kinase